MKLFQNQTVLAGSEGKRDQCGPGATVGAKPEGQQCKTANTPRAAANDGLVKGRGKVVGRETGEGD